MAIKKSSKSSKKPARGLDAIALLKDDHKKVRGLLGDLEKSSMRAGPRAQKLVAQIDKELEIHTAIEEEIFYPAFRDAVSTKDDRKMYYEAKEEHHVVKLVLPEVKEGGMAIEEFAAKCKVLKELVEHHADEEEKEMFPEARKVLSRPELQELGDRMAERKKELGA
ncbi:MAG TPA: hemerythrin domain-containing protein [Thermoanaerobaculia bacterium]|jgi:hemerythrin-like domain-containing protein|nr:hemerythrin domain-containing protein [Thermoanaerobaculia bacterium]